jgi:predicted translin family RNA/ssDNA-binding protein
MQSIVIATYSSTYVKMSSKVVKEAEKLYKVLNSPYKFLWELTTPYGVIGL